MMNGFIKKVSILILSVLVLVGGSLGSVSSVYAKSFKYQAPPDPYVMDNEYQKLLKYYVLGYKEKMSDALKVVEDHASKYFPRKHSFKDSFENGHQLIEFLLKYGLRFESGIYIFKVKNYYHVGSYYYIIQLGEPLGRLSSISSNSSKHPSPDPYVMDSANEWLYKYKVLDYKDDFDDAFRAVEKYANRDFPRRKFYKREDFPQRHFYKDVVIRSSEFHDVFKNGYEFIQFLNKYRDYFEKGIYILQIGNYHNGGFYYYIIQFE